MCAYLFAEEIKYVGSAFSYITRCGRGIWPAYLLKFVRNIGIKYVPLFYSPRICTAVQKSAFGVCREKSYETEE